MLHKLQIFRRAKLGSRRAVQFEGSVLSNLSGAMKQFTVWFGDQKWIASGNFSLPYFLSLFKGPLDRDKDDKNDFKKTKN